MLDQLIIENVLFLDIETVPAVPDFDSMSPDFKKFWEKKSASIRKENETPESVFDRAGIYAEFGKIIAICAGHITSRDGARSLRIKAFSGDDEAKVLSEFSDMLKKFSTNREVDLCAHNGKEFDFPYLARRMLINGLRIPKILDVAGRKPWETRFLDTLELWKFGDHKNYTSLDLLSHLFGIPTPKDDIDGSMVAGVYWKEKDLPRIVKYCQKDVVAVAQLLLRYKGESLIKEEQIELVS
jgi:predicted PolB exonuclease-like 3'-5' exonuclease